MSLKRFKILLVTCMMFTKPALAEEVDQCPFVLGESVEAVSRARLQEFANTFPLKKSQFEPTAKFKARQERSVKNAIPSFVILPTETLRDELYYNADEEYFFYTDQFFSGGKYVPYRPVGELFNVDEESEPHLQGIAHSVFIERKVTSDFFLVPRVTYNNIKIYGEHIFDNHDTIKTRNGKRYSVDRYYGYEPVDILEDETCCIKLKLFRPFHILPYDINDAEKFYNGVQTFTAVDMKSPVIFSEVETWPANSDFREDRTINNILIKADIICSSLVDHHGKVAQVLTPMIGYVEYEDYR